MTDTRSRWFVVSVSILLLGGATGRTARAEPLAYRPAATPAGQAASVGVDLPYTFGVHHLESGEVKGEARIDWTASPLTVSGRLTIPLASLHGGGDTFNCHMREALGLDYARSVFPGEHVCSGGKLPASGNDSVAFPEISFQLRGVTLAGDGSHLGSRFHSHLGRGEKVRVAVSGRWTIHGVSRDETLDLGLTVVETGDGHARSLRLEGSHKLRLSAYGIQVKRALVIKAGDEATVNLNLLLVEAQR